MQGYMRDECIFSKNYNFKLIDLKRKINLLHFKLNYKLKYATKKKNCKQYSRPPPCISISLLQIAESSFGCCKFVFFYILFLF